MSLSMNFPLDDRIAGVLVPVFAIRTQGDLGIGDAHSLAAFLEWAAPIGLRLVKLLPINETGGDNSPYNALSSRALDPTTIRTTPEALPDLSRVKFNEILKANPDAARDSDRVDYPAVKALKNRLLEAAFARFLKIHFAAKSARGAEFRAFGESEAEWLGDYTLFRALLELHKGEGWDGWPEEHRTIGNARAWLAGLGKRAAPFKKRRRYFAYVQWIAFQQWRAVKAQAESLGVGLMGDIPFGVSYQSADVWAEPSIFRTDWSGGTPPDTIFKHDEFVQRWGQNWGIPLYNWNALREQRFDWWRRRVRGVREFFDLFRIDHVLGFYRIYGFPWRPERNAEFLPLSREEARERTGGELPRFQPRADDSPEHKAENCREGEEYLRVVLEEAAAGHVIGEDLGEVPDYVRPNLRSLGIAGYKIPQWEKRHDGRLIAGSDYERLSLAMYATHDHDPLRQMWETLLREAREPHGDGPRWELRILCEFAGLDPERQHDFDSEAHPALLRALLNSNSWIAVVMITDLFGRAERFNSPGVAHGSWTQRMHARLEELDGDEKTRLFRALLLETGRAS